MRKMCGMSAMALGVMLTIAGSGRSQTAPATGPTTPPASGTLVTGKLVVPAEVESFADRTLELLLYEYDPRLADAPATQIDKVEIKPFSHEKGKETVRELKIGEKGTLNARRSYYITAFILNGQTRTHIGELNAKSGLAKVLTEGNPREIRVVFRAVR